MAQPVHRALSKCVYNVPLALDQPLQPLRAKNRNLEFVDGAREHIVGPMPVRDFIDEFLHLDDEPSRSGLLSSWLAFRSVPAQADTPSGIFEPLIRAMNKRTKYKARCPGFSFHNASERASLPRKLGHMKPHICCYSEQNVQTVQDSDTGLRAELGYAELFIEVKPYPSHDFFVDPPIAASPEDRAAHDFLAKSPDEFLEKHRDRAFGQHIAYVAEIFARQHRSFIFSISMSGSCARLLRWDRAGCIVSKSFDIRDQPSLLCDFLWRFAHITCVGRGHDPTVELASAEEEGIFLDAIRRHVRLQLQVDGLALEDAVSEHYDRGHIVVMHVLDGNRVSPEHPVRRFIVSRPIASSLRPTGKGTKGFWAVDPSTRDVVFLKDTWRLPPIQVREGDRVELLHRKGVRNIPSLVCHGDVPRVLPRIEEHTYVPNEMQCTLTDEFCVDEWVRKVRRKEVSLCKQWHYRLVMGTVGYSLKRFKDTEELLHATYDAFHALRDAVGQASRLHRDVSIGNIILVRENDQAIRTGYLIDWDASCPVSETGECIEGGRVGTWHFMSYKLLAPEGRERKPTLEDDMESLLYVVLYCSLLWLPHNLAKARLALILFRLFEKRDWHRDHYFGGDGKMLNAFDRQYTKLITFNQPLHEWLQTVMDYHSPQVAGQYDGFWSNPAHLDTFWGNFLQTHDLPHDDRMTHDHPAASGTYTPRSSEGLYSTEVIWLGNPSSEDPEVAAPVRRKRRRASVDRAQSAAYKRRLRSGGAANIAPPP